MNGEREYFYGYVISAFPGVGKTYCAERTKLNILDSDSTNFSWSSPGVRNPEFPQNYIDHIKANLDKGGVDFIFVSSHDVVRDALVKAGLVFTLIYPTRSMKNEYLQRYRNRGSDENFIKLLDGSWGKFMDSLEEQQNCKHIQLKNGEYLSDYMPLDWGKD